MYQSLCQVLYECLQVVTSRVRGGLTPSTCFSVLHWPVTPAKPLAVSAKPTLGQSLWACMLVTPRRLGQHIRSICCTPPAKCDVLCKAFSGSQCKACLGATIVGLYAGNAKEAWATLEVSRICQQAACQLVLLLHLSSQPMSAQVFL